MKHFILALAAISFLTLAVVLTDDGQPPQSISQVTRWVVIVDSNGADVRVSPTFDAEQDAEDFKAVYVRKNLGVANPRVRPVTSVIPSE